MQFAVFQVSVLKLFSTCFLLQLIHLIHFSHIFTPFPRFVNTFGLGFMMTEALRSQTSVNHRKSRSSSKKNMKRKDGEPCERRCTCDHIIEHYRSILLKLSLTIFLFCLQVCPPRTGKSDCVRSSLHLWVLCQQHKQYPRGAASQNPASEQDSVQAGISLRTLSALPNHC